MTARARNGFLANRRPQKFDTSPNSYFSTSLATRPTNLIARSVALNQDGGPMPRKSTAKKARRKLAGDALVVAKPHVSEEVYKVGPGCPPREFQFKKGQSGNPKGARRKANSIAPDLKAHLERALNGKVALLEGERERFVSKAAAGIERLVEQFAEGDRHARRDLIDLAHRLDVDLTAGHGREKALQAPASAEDQAVLADYFKRFDGAHDDTSEPQSTQSPDPSNEDGEEHD